MTRDGKNLRSLADMALAERDRWRLLVSTSKTLHMFSRPLVTDFVLLGFLWNLKL